MFSSLSPEQKKAVLSGSYVAVSGLNEIKASIPKLSQGISQSSQGMASLDSNMSALASGAQKLSDGTSLLEKSAPQIVSGISTLSDGSKKLSDGSWKLSSGAKELDSKSPELESGAYRISDRAGKLHLGSLDLLKGAGELDSALLSLKSGTGELSDKLQDGAEEIGSLKTDENTVEQISSPTDIVEKEYSHVPNYGHALAPYVMSLALFIGCLVFNSIFPIRELSDKIRSSSSWYFGKFSVGLAVASTMALVEGSVMIALGLEVNNKLKFFAVLLLTALCYMSIIMTLSMALDNPGRFLSMLLLIVQLGGSGGTFPIELTNGFFQTIHPYLPMSYSIYGLREAISGGIGVHSFIKSISVLSGIFVVFSLILFFVMNKLFKGFHKKEECLGL
jgi:putative membrane protein